MVIDVQLDSVKVDVHGRGITVMEAVDIVGMKVLVGTGGRKVSFTSSI